MNLSKKALALLGATSMLIAMAGCSAPAEPEEADPAPTDASGDMCTTKLDGEKVTLTVSNVIEGFAPLVIAMENGAFEDAGLDVTIEKVSASDSLAQIGAGRIDGQLTSYSVGNMNAVASGVEMKWVAPFYAIPEPEEGMPLPGYWARTEYVGDAEEIDLTGLQGQMVSSPTSGSGAGGMVLEKELEKFDMSVADVTFTAASGGDALIGLENGAVAAAWISAPFTQVAAEDPELRLAATYDTGINGSGLIVGPSLLDRPDVLTKLLQVMAETNAEYLQGNYHENPEALALLATGLEQSEEAIAEGIPYVFDPTLDMTGAAQYVEDLQAFTRSQDALDYEEDIPADELISTEFAEAAAACLS